MSRRAKYSTIEERRKAQYKQTRESAERARIREQWRSLVAIRPDVYTEPYEDWEAAIADIMSLQRNLENFLHEEGLGKVVRVEVREKVVAEKMTGRYEEAGSLPSLEKLKEQARLERLREEAEIEKRNE